MDAPERGIWDACLYMDYKIHLEQQEVLVNLVPLDSLLKKI